LQAAGRQQFTDTAQGSYLNANPYLDTAIDAASRGVTRNYNDVVQPGISGGFSKAGRLGSGLHLRAQEGAQEQLARALGDISGSMSFQNYAQERDRMQQASAAAPQIAAADYQDADRLQQVGGMREQLAGANLQDQINRFMHEQQAPRDALQQYASQVAGGTYGGTTTKAQPIYSNKFQQGLSAASGLAGIGGTLFGSSSGIFPDFF
jgi:hypothetical protein